MSKSNDSDQIAEAKAPGTNPIELLKAPKGPLGSPPDTFPRPSQQRTLGENEVTPGNTPGGKKEQTTPEFKVAMAPESQVGSHRAGETTQKPAEASISKDTFVEKVGTEPKPANGDNKKNLSRSLSDLKPAAAALPTENPQAPKVEPQPENYSNRVKEQKKPTPSSKTPERQPSQKSEAQSHWLQNIKPPAPTKKPPIGPKR